MSGKEDEGEDEGEGDGDGKERVERKAFLPWTLPCTNDWRTMHDSFEFMNNAHYSAIS
jgi:hypothetical protein